MISKVPTLSFIETNMRLAVDADKQAKEFRTIAMQSAATMVNELLGNLRDLGICLHECNDNEMIISYCEYDEDIQKIWFEVEHFKED